MRDSNVGPREIIVRESMLASLDQLPIELRKVLTEAPYNYAASELVEAWSKLLRAGCDGKEAIALLKRNAENLFRAEIAIRARVFYGPEHPLAAGVTKQELIELNLLDVAIANDAWRAQWSRSK